MQFAVRRLEVLSNFVSIKSSIAKISVLRKNEKVGVADLFPGNTASTYAIPNQEETKVQAKSGPAELLDTPAVELVSLVAAC